MEHRRILIVSHPTDLHARAAAFAIRQKGHTCEEFFCPDFPTLTSITLGETGDAAPSRAEVCVEHLDGTFEAGNGFDTIWLRRIDDPWVPMDMHPGDREVAYRHCSRMVWDFLAALDGPGVFWVNDLRRQRIHPLKLYQLNQARRAGLAIPPTIVTNSPERMREFIRACGGRAAYKLIEHATWRRRDDRRFATYTTPITEDDLVSDETVRLCPAILQPLVAKQFEVRVACFGNQLVACQLDSQSDARASTDWRQGQWYIDVAPYMLPDEIAAGIRRFLRATGMVSASLDFIVTPQGDHVFLEANPQGQFLWIEERTGLPLLDTVTDFLIERDPEFRYRRSSPAVAWSDYASVVGPDFSALTGRHVPHRHFRGAFPDD